HARSVDVELRVGAGRAAVLDRDLDQLLARGVDRLAHRLEDRAALLEGHRAQRRAALLAREVERRAEVEAARAGLGDRLARRRVVERREVAAAFHPLAAQIALERDHPSPLSIMPSSWDRQPASPAPAVAMRQLTKGGAASRTRIA